MRGRVFAALLLAALPCQAAPVFADQPVTFDSVASRRFQTRFARDRGEPMTVIPATRIQGYLSRPDGDGPFGAVIVLHGCDGLSAARRAFAETVAGWGYVTLAVDDFTTRGLRQSCVESTFNETVQDALGATAYLASLSYVDPRRIAVVGFAQGGTTALHLALNRLPPIDGLVPPLPKAAVGVYPWCADTRGRLAAQTLILIGTRDDWTPSSFCDQFVQRHAGDGVEVRLVLFPGAYHRFDDKEAASGRNLFGHWLQYDAEATERAMNEMRDFLAKHLAAN